MTEAIAGAADADDAPAAGFPEEARPAAGSGAGAGVGAELARARLAAGMSVADVARLMKFAPRQIEAIEAERFDALPAGTFVRGMVRSYARLLRLDPDPLLARLAGRIAPPPGAQQLAERFTQPVPFHDRGRRSTVLHLGLSIAVLALVAGVAYEWHREQSAPPAPQQAAAEPRPEPVAATPAVSAPSAGESESPAQPPATPVAASEDPAPTSSVAVAGTPVSAAAERPAGGSSFGRIVLTCVRDSWIEVKDAEDRVLISSLNQAGSERVVEGRGPFTVIIGNAQGVRLRYNDRPVDLRPHTKVEVARLVLP